MNKITRTLRYAMAASVAAAALPVLAKPPAPPAQFDWDTVVNNTDLMPTEDEGCNKTPKPRRCFFNSYNQPSVNVDGLVVIRARSKGGGGSGGGESVVINAEQGNQPIHGIYTRDMSNPGSPGDITRILDRTTVVPQPNNQGTKFVETPSFPRIDMLSDTIATRGNHQPVWKVGEDEPLGTTGIYTNPFGSLITGASKLGGVKKFSFFEVPGAPAMTPFDVFPGAPAVTTLQTTSADTIVFKGNYTVNGVGKTGVFFRELTDKPIVVEGTGLAPAGGMSDVVLIANNTDTKIPGTNQVFGSTSPPSAADGKVVFAGFDNEEKPTLGGIYLATLGNTSPPLTTLVRIGQKVPGESGNKTFNNLGEGGAFDGKYVGFWGAWGNGTKTVRLYCPTEGNKDRRDYCNKQLVCADTGLTIGDPNSTCDATGCWQEKKVPVQQGIFLHDTVSGTTRAVAKIGAQFDEFVFWNYSGKTPCMSAGGHGQEGAEDDGEPARWRSSAFVAVSGERTAFKAVAGGGMQQGCGSCHSGDIGPVPPSPFHGRLQGIYLNKKPGLEILTAVDTRTDGQAVDPEAPAGTKVTEVGLEREGLRGNWLVINAKMGVAGGSEEEGMAGVYITTPVLP